MNFVGTLTAIDIVVPWQAQVIFVIYLIDSLVPEQNYSDRTCAKKVPG